MGAAIVLVVEDEALIRLDAVQMIEDAGYEVVEAANADAAIRILESRPDIHIVFTDVNMPGSMDGLKLARAIRDRWPPVHLIVTSGKHMVHPSDLPTGGRFIPKPYNARMVTSVLHDLAPLA
ncbi:MAG TPA: response regulator [Rhizomicrobium sp.]